MLFRRLLAASPLALVVAVAAHAAGFGSSHLLGGAYGLDVLRLALAWLGLVAVGGTIWAGLAASRQSLKANAARLLDALPASGRFAGLALSLALGGTAIFSALEATEGHLDAPSLPSLAALGLGAAAVAAFVRLAAWAIAAIGASLASLTREIVARPQAQARLTLAPARVRHADPSVALWRGRAPPYTA